MLALRQVHQFELERADVERQFEQPQRQQLRELTGQLGRQHDGQVGMGDQVRRLQVIGRGVDDFSRQALLAQPLVDHAARLTAADPQMTQAQKVIQREGVECQWMVFAHGQAQGFAVPRAAGEPRRHLFEAPQHHVQFTLVQQLGRQAGGEVGDVDPQVRRQFAQARQQGRHAQLFDKVGEGDAHLLLAHAWVEGFAGIECLFDLLQGRANRPFKRQRPGGGLHVAANAHQQRVVEQGAQAGEGVADGGLAERQALGRPRHVLLAQQHVEHSQQIQVEGF